MIGRKQECGPLVEEYRRWHTPVIGAYLLYIFAKEYKKRYKEEHREERNPDFILMAIAATILSNPELCAAIKGRQSIVTIKNNLKKRNRHALLNSIHNSIKETLPYTLAALDIALHCGILLLHADNAEYEALGIKTKRGTSAFISQTAKNGESYANTIARLFASFKDSVRVAQALEVSL